MTTYLRYLATRSLLSATRKLIPPEKPRVVHVHIADVDLLVLANEDVGRQLVCRRYEHDDWRFLVGQIQPTDVCVDVGANTGFYTMLMAAAALDGQVHAFEPSVLDWHLLSAGAAINGFDNVRSNNLALADAPGERLFSVAVDSAYSSFLSTGRKREARSLSVQVETLDRYLATSTTTSVNIMKVDVEGAEKLVLDGASCLLDSRDRRPRIVLIELYDPNLRPYETSVSDVVGVMRRHGYHPYWIDPGGRPQPFQANHYNRKYNVFFLTSEVQL